MLTVFCHCPNIHPCRNDTALTDRGTEMKLADHQAIYVRSMGKALRVTAMFTDVAEANQYMEKNLDDGVIAEYGGVIFLANVYDTGVKIEGEMKLEKRHPVRHVNYQR